MRECSSCRASVRRFICGGAGRQERKDEGEGTLFPPGGSVNRIRRAEDLKRGQKR